MEISSFFFVVTVLFIMVKNGEGRFLLLKLNVAENSNLENPDASENNVEGTINRGN